MSPLECSECFGDQVLHRTYTWQLTLRGAAEHFLRLHNSYSPAGCVRQAVLPRLSRRVASQHSYPLNCFSFMPLDPMERPMSQADLELDYNPPRVQLSDEMFVFQDGRWVNENCRLQSPYFSPSASFHHKLHQKRLAKDCVLQEENKTLREETRLLREETRLLLKENKLLQVFWEEHKALRGREESRAPSPLLQKNSASPEGVKKDHAALQGPRSKEDSTLQPLREENRALQQLLEQRRTYWAQAEDAAAPAEESKPAASPHEEPHSPGLLQDQGSCLSSHFEEPKGPLATQEDSRVMRTLQEMVGNMSGPSGEEDAKAGPGLPDDCQPLQLLREMSQALQALREENPLLQEENRALQALWEERRGFLEENKALWENNKLKLQLKLVIDTVTKVTDTVTGVTTRMEMLIEELYAFMPARSKDPKKPSRV
ncbi:protein chibby homolog 2 isoform X2 [Aotus nancymaae]|uniref:protein chibby homolog 2 isoform X2 n=1 Tax=Aotus nancymaae TaxID=37293 RepID=UPI0030FF1D9B